MVTKRPKTSGTEVKRDGEDSVFYSNAAVKIGLRRPKVIENVTKNFGNGPNFFTKLIKNGV